MVNTAQLNAFSRERGKGKNDKATPQWLFNHLNYEFHFDTDVCATPENAKCVRHFTPEDDGLSQRWIGSCFINPPYSDIGPWMAKACESWILDGTTVVCVVPCWTDRGWWHDYAMKGEIRFIKGRINFAGHRFGTAPFPVAVVVFGGKPTDFGTIDSAEEFIP